MKASTAAFLQSSILGDDHYHYHYHYHYCGLKLTTYAYFPKLPMSKLRNSKKYRPKF